MKIEDVQKAQELLVKLDNGLEDQAKILLALKKSLEEYRDFLWKEIKSVRDE